jgi:peptide/nickel transport system substrate-binding protein
MRRSPRTIAVRLVGMLLITAACTSEGEGGERSTGPEARPLQGGTLRIAVPDSALEDLGCDLDPQRCYVSSAWELFRCCLLRTLYSYNGAPTEEGGAEPRPDLASGPAEVSADGLTWTFRLRGGLRYAPPFDDTPIVALDIVRALERTARVGSGGGYPFYYSPIRGFRDYEAGRADTIAGLETPDDRTLVVRLEEVTSDLAYRFAMPSTAPIPEGADEGHDEDYGRFLVASGPYMVEGSGDIDFTSLPDQQEPAAGFIPPTYTEDGALQQPGSLVFVRNRSWNPGTDRLRAAYADRIELSLGGFDDEEISRRVDAAETDLVFPMDSPFEQVSRYRNDPALSDRLYAHAQNGFWGVTMNIALPPFDDVHVRRAVAHAIDKVPLIEMLSEPPYGPFGLSFGEVATHLSTDALGAGLLRAFDPYPYDPPAAQDEMRASVYDRDSDGRCDARACRAVQALVMDAGVLPKQAKAIRDDLAEIGIELVLQVVPVEGFFGDFETGEFAGTIHDPRAHVAMGIAYPWVADFPEGGGWFPSLFDSPGIPSPDVSLVGATRAELRDWEYRVTSVPSIDDRIQVCLESRGVSRTECWVELDQYLMTEMVPWVPVIFLDRALVVSERVVAYQLDQFASLPALDRIALAPGSS